MMNDLRRDIASFLSRGFIACLATVDEFCEPDICTVIYAQDEQLNLYFKSRTTSRHTRNLVTHPRCAVAVYDHGSTYTEKSGVQLIGQAHRITDTRQMKRAVDTYLARFGPEGAKFPDIDGLLLPDIPSTMFKFEPMRAKFLNKSQQMNDYVSLA